MSLHITLEHIGTRMWPVAVAHYPREVWGGGVFEHLSVMLYETRRTSREGSAECTERLRSCRHPGRHRGLVGPVGGSWM